MNKKIYIFVALMIVVIAIIIVFDPREGTDRIKIGVITPLSGIVADYGEEVRKGVLAAGVDDVDLVFEDEKCEPKDAISAFKKLTEFDKIHFIIGPVCGSSQEAVAPLTRDKDIVMIVPSAASSKLYTESGGNIFNIQYSLEDESKFIAESMYGRNLKRIVLIGYRNAFSETHADSFRANYRGVIAREIWFTTETADVSTELVKLRGLGFDAIFSTDINFFFGNGLEKLSQLGIDVPVYSQYAVELPAVRSLVEGVTYSFPGDMTGEQGAIYNLSKEAALQLYSIVKDCGDDYVCVKKTLDDSGKYEEGVNKRTIILKQIKGGIPVEI